MENAKPFRPRHILGQCPFEALFRKNKLEYHRHERSRGLTHGPSTSSEIATVFHLLDAIEAYRLLF